MSNKKVWLVTGSSRGMGVDFVKAALAAGHAVVASGRDTERVSKALGQSDDLLAVKLDVTSGADAEAAVGPQSIGSATSTYWSTTPRASTPAISRS